MKGYHYWFGILAVIVFYVISGFVTKKQNQVFNFNPFALAIGDDNNHSISLFQNLIFTYITIFAYVTVYAARIEVKLFVLLGIPINLLILLGLNVITATASKGIVVSYQGSGTMVPIVNSELTGDKSDLVREKDGNVALTKVQMLIWTFISAGIYLHTIIFFIEQKLYLQENVKALPDVDGALLVLMGVSQGAYIGGKLVSGRSTAPIIESILPAPISIKSTKRLIIIGGLFGESHEGNTIIFRNTSTGKTNEVAKNTSLIWTDKRIEFDIPFVDNKEMGLYKIWIRSRGFVSDEYNVVVGE